MGRKKFPINQILNQVIVASRAETPQMADKVLNAALGSKLGSSELGSKGAGLVFVPSSRDRSYYRVDTEARTCNCKAGLNGKDCYHLKAADLAQKIFYQLTEADVHWSDYG